MKQAETETLVIVGGVLVVSMVAMYLVKKAAGAAGGILSGDNALTQNQTDAQGNTVTAYQGAGVVGTLGAAANTASGGTLASIGEWLGSTAYDLLHPSGATTTTTAQDPATQRIIDENYNWQFHGAR